jgi:hypothetical protein
MPLPCGSNFTLTCTEAGFAARYIDNYQLALSRD